MSSAPENTFIASIHKLLPKSLYRMKNHNQFNSGIPDCWYSGRGCDLWIEYKFIVLPKRETTVLTFRFSPLQIKWIEDRYVEGRKVCAVIGSRDWGVIIQAHELEDPMTKTNFLNRGLSRQEIANYITTIVSHDG